MWYDIVALQWLQPYVPSVVYFWEMGCFPFTFPSFSFGLCWNVRGLKCYYYLPIVLITVVVIDRHTEIKVNDRPPLVFFYIYLFFSLSHCIPDLRALLRYSVGNTTPVVGEWEY